MGKIEKYQNLPDGFPTLLNKMLRAVHVSRPLEAARFLADYLEAEVNRRILCDLQLSQTCPSGLVAPSDPWVQYMSFVTIQGAIDDLMREEDPNYKSSFQWNDDLNLLNVEKRSSARRRIKRFPWPPVAKAMPHCRLRYDRYGPIVKTISISRRSIRRYMKDKLLVAEEGFHESDVDKCRRRRPIADYWRQILRDCSVKANLRNRKKEEEEENPRGRRRSASLTEMTSSEGEEEKGGGEDGGSVDPYLETKRRRKARNDEGLANIIYRELGTPRPGPPPPAAAAPAVKKVEVVEEHPPPEWDGELRPGKENKAVQVELVRSVLPRPRPPPPTCPPPPSPPSPPPPPTPSQVIEVVIPPVETFDKAVQVDLEDTSTEDRPSTYPDPGCVAAEMDLDVAITCPPPPLPEPLEDFDWSPFLLQPSPPLWTESDIDWMMMMTLEQKEDEQPGDVSVPVPDVHAVYAEQSPMDDAMPEQVVQLVDLDFPAASTVADAPAVELLLGERDPPASSTVADVPAEPFHLEGDDPAHSPAADGPADPLLPSQESASKLMEVDEVDDPFDDYGPPTTFTLGHSSSTSVPEIHEPVEESEENHVKRVTSKGSKTSSHDSHNRLSPP